LNRENAVAFSSIHPIQDAPDFMEAETATTVSVPVPVSIPIGAVSFSPGEPFGGRSLDSETESAGLPQDSSGGLAPDQMLAMFTSFWERLCIIR
jgi:hypothetical protein